VLACLVVLPALLLYRELTGSLKGAVIGALLLFTQPEFLFVILRSSHEKFTRALMLFCLFLLVRSINVSDRRHLFAIYVTLFYVVVFAIIASNSLIAHSFIFAMAVALIIAKVLGRRNSAFTSLSNQSLARLPYVFMTSLAGVYLFMFYLYPPAMHHIGVYETLGDQLAALLLNTEASTPTNAYSVMSTGWTSIYAYLLISAANWILLFASFAIWVRQGIRWFWRGQSSDSHTSLIIWLLYGAYGFQGLLSVVVDLSGGLSSNTQQRLLPSLTVFAVALVANALINWQPRRFPNAARVSLATAILLVAIFSVFKATNEPIVSNSWSFYQPAEIVAVDWSDSHLTNSPIWTDYDGRLTIAFHTERRGSKAENHIFGGPMTPTTRTVVFSDVTRHRSLRLGREYPMPSDAHRIYDNGGAEVYGLRPETPFQR
jgi:hypothetical protein